MAIRPFLLIDKVESESETESDAECEWKKNSSTKKLLPPSTRAFEELSKDIFNVEIGWFYVCKKWNRTYNYLN